MIHEQILIGHLIREKRAFTAVRLKRLSSYEFQDRNCQRAFAFMEKAEILGLEPTLDYLLCNCNGDIDFIGWLRATAELGGTGENVEHYAQMIKSLALLRHISTGALALGEKAAKASYDRLDAVRADVMAYADSALTQNGETKRVRSFSEVAVEDARRLMRQIDCFKKGLPSGITTGLRDLNHNLGGGWQPGSVIVIAGRTGTGKTGLGLTHTLAAASAGYSVLFVTVELSGEQVLRKMVSNDGRLSLEAVILGRLTENDRKTFRTSCERLKETGQIYILDRFGNDFNTMMLEIERHRRSKPLAIVVIDGVQLLRCPGTKFDRRLELSHISNSIKAYALQHSLVFLVVAQLSRAAEESDSGPQLHHLKETGSFEEDADAVVMIHHVEQKDEQGNVKRDAHGNPLKDTLLRVRKNRWNVDGDIMVGCDLAHSRFYDLPRRSV